MALPTQYLTSSKNVKGILQAMQAAQAPKKFTTTFLQGLGFKNVSDRLIIGMLKALGLLNPNGEPTQRYFDFLDQSQGARVLAEGIREAYADLFQVNNKANDLTQKEIKNKLKTLTQGQSSDAVLEKMALTFKTLSGLADFTAEVATQPKLPDATAKEQKAEPVSLPRRDVTGALGGLVYNIQIHLPESRDPAVYDALFRSLREHLL